MEEFIKRLCKLVDLKSIITIIVVVTMVVGFFMNKITSEQLIPYVSMILTFYFSRQEKKVDDTPTGVSNEE